MKTLPPVPKSIPKHVRAQVKAKGLIYVGMGDFGKPIFGYREEKCLRYSPEGDALTEGNYIGSLSRFHYFTTPKIAAKYFTLPKKTHKIPPRGANGRFVSPKPPAAQAKKEEKARRPKIGEVWRSDYGMDFLVARVSISTALLIAVCEANRKNERALEIHDGSVANDQNLTFVAPSLKEYFKNKS